jgi:hypothetical protein
MTNTQGLPSTEDVPEADLAEQRMAADPTDEDEGLNPAYPENAGDIDANPADVIDQSINVPLPSDDYQDR